MSEAFPFQMDSHVDWPSWPEWGSAPRGPLVDFDAAHRGEWLESVIGPDPATWTPRIYHIVRCELCILTHVWPLPNAEALATYYAEQFYQMDHADYVARYEADRAWWEQCVHGPILEQCHEEFLLKTGRGLLSMLEVGSGPGIALDVARRRFGWDTRGLEPNFELCLELDKREHDPIYGTLEKMMAIRRNHKITEAWDILYLYEVLEHQPNPESFLLDCYEILNPGGLIVVVVPNDYNPIQLEAQRTLNLKPYWLAAPQLLHPQNPATGAAPFRLLPGRFTRDVSDRPASPQGSKLHRQ